MWAASSMMFYSAMFAGMAGTPSPEAFEAGDFGGDMGGDMGGMDGMSDVGGAEGMGDMGGFEGGGFDGGGFDFGFDF